MMLPIQSLGLRPLTTAHLAQTMSLLELNSDELRQKIEAELASNPALEVIDEYRCPTCHRPLANPRACPFCNKSSLDYSDQPIIFVSPMKDFQSFSGRDSDDFEPEDFNPSYVSLPEFILQQIAPDLKPEDRPIAAHVLTSLDDDGLLRTPLIEIARYHHVPLSRIQQVIKLIQRSDPVGSGSSTPQEALLVQLEVLEENHPVPRMAKQAITEGLELLSKHAYNELGRVLKISPREARLLAEYIINNLNPYPARSHWGNVHFREQSVSNYLSPDVLISYLDQGKNNSLVVEILSPFAGSLRVNPLFKESLEQAPSDKTESWHNQLEQANLLVKCLQQRNNTVVRLMEQVVRLQLKFILEGDAYLVPITRAQLALELSVHESTVSRAVSGKAVQLPNKRIIPMDKFFDRSLQVRTALRDMIENETRPMSDTEIAGQLLTLGYPVARRTVAKYRAMEGILPARYRMQFVG